MTAPQNSSIKIDSKGRILLPPDLRDELDLEPGDTVSLERTKTGLIVKPARKADYISRLKQMLDTPPKRTGKPKYWTPSEMKKIWKTS